MKKKILLLVDHRRRDLPSCVYLSLFLERYGYDVFLCRTGYEKSVIPFYQPNLIIYHWVHDPEQIEYIKSIKKYGILIAAIYTEGKGWAPKQDEFIAGQFNDLSLVDLQFAWNNKIEELIRKFRKTATRYIYTAGVPRFDFYVPPLSKILRTKEQFCRQYNLDTSKPIVTWTTNYSAADYSDTLDIEWFKKVFDKYKITNVPAFSDVSRLVKIDLESRLKMSDCIVRLADDFSDRINICIKHHPSEVITYYKELMKKIMKASQNVALISEEYIWDVLNPTDILIQRSCTTGLEAWMLNKPTIECRIQPELLVSDEILDGHDVIHNYGHLKERILSYLEGNTEINEEKKSFRDKLLCDWYYRIDGHRTVEHARIIDAFLRENDNGIIHIPWQKDTYVAKLKNIITRYTGIKYYYSLNPIAYIHTGLRASKIKKTARLITEKDIKFWRWKLTPYVKE